VQTLPESSTSKPFTLVLIANLPRSQLPLAWIDPVPSTIQVPARLIFHADIPTTLRPECVSREGHNVWIVRQPPNGRLYAVETLGCNTYVGCLLAGWVTEERIVAGRGSLSEKYLLERILSSGQISAARPSSSRPSSSRPSSQHGVPEQPFGVSPKKPKNRRGVLARLSIIPSKDASAMSQNPVIPDKEPPQQHLEHDMPQPAIDGNFARETMPTSPAILAQDTSLLYDKGGNGEPQPLYPQDNDTVPADSLDAVRSDVQSVLETLHQQYLETLYTSKTSLAYFAKGPLVRARTQIQSMPTRHHSALADFCREGIIPTKKMDLKYRDSIVNILQALDLVEVSNGAEGLPKASTKSKAKQKPSKRKIGKDGLYPAEKEFIVSWWRGRTLGDSDVPTAEAQTRDMKSGIADLRTRETEMQVLLALEALALEAAEKSSVPDSASKPLIKEEPPEPEQEVTLAALPRYKKKKKRQDLKSELDLLIDRLCIWHTVGLEDFSTSYSENQKTDSGRDSHSKDRLRDFCSDVIIPFYAARLPEQCKAICQKLGGPQISPNRPRKTLQKSLSSSRVLPGAEVKAPHGAAAKQTLQRVLSEDQSSRHGSPSVLSRSSTAPLLLNLKREATEPPQRPESRGGLQKSRSFANREIDLVGDAKTQEVKQKKLANLAKQKQEIDAAINALRKPNRGLAAKEIADEMERHRVPAVNLTKRNGVGIQVNATPKKSKRNTAEQSFGFQSGSSTRGPLPEPPVNELSVPSSTIRPSSAAQANNRFHTSNIKRAVITAVNDTPAREPSKKSDPLGLIKRSESFELFSAGKDTDKVPSNAAPLIQATPPTNRLRSDILTSIQNTPLRMKKSQKPVLFTPMKKADVMMDDVFKDAPEIPEQAGKAMARVMGGGSTMSIYDSLGWNDDFGT
jgi:DNA replication regulator SLD3